jgi:hypothetical protein
MNEKTSVLVIASVISLIVAAALWFLCFRIVATPLDGYLNLAVILASISFGWLLGTFVSPESDREQQSFMTYGKAVSAFVSGYLVSKLDKVIDRILSPEILAMPVAAFRLAGSIAAIISALLVTYIVRAYVYGKSS